MKGGTDSARSRIGTLLAAAAAVLCAAALLVFFFSRALPLGGDAELSGHGVFALVLGVGFSLVLGIGLMALVFFSNRRGYDDHAAGGRPGEGRSPQPDRRPEPH